MDKVRKSCPLSTASYSVNRIVFLPSKSSDKSFGLARFETAEKEIEVTCSWWVNIMPEMTELVIKWLGAEGLTSIEL